MEFTEPNFRFSATGVPNDASFKDLYGLHNTSQTGGTAGADVDASEGWDLAYGAGSFPSTGGVRVGIVDTGIDRNHADVGAKTKVEEGPHGRSDARCAHVHRRRQGPRRPRHLLRLRPRQPRAGGGLTPCSFWARRTTVTGVRRAQKAG